jgi:hypothetical protein
VIHAEPRAEIAKYAIFSGVDFLGQRSNAR